MKKSYSLSESDQGLDADEVEILEVVGVDDDDPGWPEDDGEDTVDDGDQDIVLSLDGDEQDDAAGVASTPSGTPAGAAGVDLEQMLRLQADYDNLRKRVDREREDFEAYATSSLVGRLLPVLDNFERALAVEGAEAHGSLREGLVMISKHLFDELRREGLQPIEAVGCEFNPNLHDAVATDDRSDSPANTIVEELQRGYMFGDRVLRPAMVRVSTNGDTPNEDAP